MERHGEPIDSVPVRTLHTGITFRNGFPPGFVPELEEREAARYGGYTWFEWQKLPRRERVDGVAYFRIMKTIEQHQHDAAERQARQQAKANR